MASLEQKDISVYITNQAAEGVVDANPAFKIIRGTGGVVQSSPTYTTSNEIVTDGQAAQQVQDRQESTFTREFDVSKETISLFGEVVHGVKVDNTQAASTAVAATALGFTMPAAMVTALSVGDWFALVGFTNPLLDKRYKVATIPTGTTITTSEAPIATESVGASVVMTSFKTASGITKTLRSIQNRVTDESKADNTDFKTFLNCFASTGSVSIDKSGIVTGSIEFKVPKPLKGSAKIVGQTDAAKDASPVVSAINNIGAFYENGVNSNCNIQTMNIEFTNNYEGDGGAAGCIDEQFGRGTIAVSGSVVARTVKANSFLWKDKNLNGTRQSIAVEFKWPDGDWAIMEVTRAVITSHTFTDGDIVVSNSMDFAGDPDSVTGSTFQIFSSF